MWPSDWAKADVTRGLRTLRGVDLDAVCQIMGLRQELDPIFHDVAKTLEDLANVLRKMGRSHEAVALDLQAREIRAKRS